MKKRNLIAGNIAILGSRYEKIPDLPPFDNHVKNEVRQQILELLSNSLSYTRECLCGESLTESYEVLSLVERNFLPIRNIICKKCGIIRIDPLPEKHFFNELYSKLYWKLLHGNVDLTKDRFLFSSKRAIPFFNYLNNTCSLKSKKVLEIGASYGAGLFVLKDQGCRCLVGYDYDEKFIKKGIEYSGVDLRRGGIYEAVKDGLKYDVIILRHVLEHFLDPLYELNEIKKIISEEGMLFIEVPSVFNLKNYAYDPMMYFDIFHSFSYSLKTLTMVMNMSGYSMFDGNDHIYSLWKIDKSLNGKCKIFNNEYLDIKNHLIISELQRVKIEKFSNSIVGKMIRVCSNYFK